MKLGAPEPIAALNRVRIVESGEPLVDVRAHCPAVDVLERVCPYLRRTVADMLNAGAAGLPHGYRFRVGTALRTLSMQRKGWDRAYRRIRREHPEWPLSAVRRAVNRFHAPYDQPAPPGHCTGAAVDVILLGPNGRPADVTSPLDRWEAAYTWTEKISPQARQNRMYMVEAMLAAGFSNCREEYWHYSWGDSAWAVRVGKDECPYGFVEPEPAVEARHRGGIAAQIERTGEREWLCVPAKGRLEVGLLWAEGHEATLRITWPAGATAVVEVSRNRKRWSVRAARQEAGELHVTLRPPAPRTFVRVVPSAVQPSIDL